MSKKVEEALTEAAEAETAEAQAATVTAGVTAAEAGVAAATAGAVLATTAAAKVAQDATEAAEELEEEQVWLRQQLTQQGKALEGLAAMQSQLQTQTAATAGTLEKLASILEKPPAAAPVNPEEAATKEASSPEPNGGHTEPVKKKPAKPPAEAHSQRHWI